MKYILSVFFLVLLFMGCNNDFKNQSEPFSITLTSTSNLQNTAMSAAPRVPVNARIILHSSSELKASTVTPNNIYIQQTNGTKVSIDLDYANQSITLLPIIHLSPNIDYEIIITTGLQNSRGEHLSHDYTIAFTSTNQVDLTGPTLYNTLPQDGNDVNPFVQLFLQFSEPISPIDFDPSAFKVYSEPTYTTEVPGSVTLSGSIIRFTPDENLLFETGYRIQLSTSSIYDLAGNSYLGGSQEVVNFGIYASGSETNNITLPELTQPYNLGGIAYTIKSDGNILFVGGENGLHIYQYGNNTLQLQAHLPYETVGAVYSTDFNATAQRLYIASSKGFHIVGTQLLSEAELLSSYHVYNAYENQVPIYGLSINTNKAYLAASSEGLIALDITNELQPQSLFRIDTDGTAFDVIQMDSTLALADFNQGTKIFSTSGQVFTPPSPQGKGQDRRLFPFPTTDISGNPSFDYYIAAGIGGIKYWDSYNGFGDLPSTYASSYISDIVKNRENSSKNFANALGIGIAYTSGSSVSTYQLLPYTSTTIGYLNDNGTEIIFAADTNGLLHMYKGN